VAGRQCAITAEVAYSSEESLDLLAVLEDARDALVDSDHLAVVA
jgi:hypothetical protein